LVAMHSTADRQLTPAFKQNLDFATGRNPLLHKIAKS